MVEIRDESVLESWGHRSEEGNLFPAVGDQVEVIRQVGIL